MGQPQSALGGQGSCSAQRCVQPLVYPGVKRHENSLLPAAVTLLENRKDFLFGSKAAPEQLLCRIMLNSAKKYSGGVWFLNIH